MKFSQFLNESKDKIRSLIVKKLNYRDALLSYVDTGSLSTYIKSLKDNITVAKEIEKQIQSTELNKESKGKIRVLINKKLNFKEALMSFVDTNSLSDYIDEIKSRIDIANDIESQIKSKLNESKETKFDPEFDKSYTKATKETLKAVKAAISIKEINDLIKKDISKSQMDMEFVNNTVHLYGTHRNGDHIIALFKYVYAFENEDFDEEDEDSHEENYSIGIAAINLNTGKLIAGGGEDGRDQYDFDDEAVEYLEKHCLSLSFSNKD